MSYCLTLLLYNNTKEQSLFISLKCGASQLKVQCATDIKLKPVL